MSKVQGKRKASTAIVEPKPRTQERGWLIWVLWTLLYALGGMMGSLASNWVTDAVFPGGGAALGLSVSLPQLLVGMLGTFVFGAIIGLATWVLLRMYDSGMLWWSVLTGLGLTLGSLVALMALPLVLPLPSDETNAQQVTLLRDSINSAIIGLLIGAAQAILWIRRGKNRGSIITFVATSALGWLGLSLVASQLITATENMTGLGAMRQLGILFISFAVAGAISGIELPTLLKKAAQKPAVEAKSDDDHAAAGAD